MSSFTSLGEGGGTRSVTEGVLLSAKLPQSPYGDSPLTEGAENRQHDFIITLHPPHGGCFF